MLPRLAIITTHPIQYNAPVFKLLAERVKVQVKVFYTWEQAKEKVYDVNFKREIKWDIPLLEGYDYAFVKNVAKNPGSHHFRGIDNPTLLIEIEKFNPEAILVYGWSFKSHLKALRHFKDKVTVLFRGDSVLLVEQSPLKKLARKLFLTWVYSYVDKALYVGENNKAYYEAFGLKKNQLVFSPHAVDNKRFASYINERSAINWRENLGIGKDEIVFLFAGKFEPRKNPSLLIKAFIKLKANDAHLVMVGNGILEEEVKRISTSITNIHFVDFQNQKTMPSVYGFADVFVLSSQSETWGLAVNEAMACSKAVLVSDKCGCAVDLVDEGINGFIFQSNNEEDLILKLNQFSVKTNSELTAMGENSNSKIQDWSFVNICTSIESAL